MNISYCGLYERTAHEMRFFLYYNLDSHLHWRTCVADTDRCISIYELYNDRSFSILAGILWPHWQEKESSGTYARNVSEMWGECCVQIQPFDGVCQLPRSTKLKSSGMQWQKTILKEVAKAGHRLWNIKSCMTCLSQKAEVFSFLWLQDSNLFRSL